MSKVIHTPNAPAAVGPYSQAIDCGDLVFCSGQIPLVPATGEVVEGGIEAQTRQIFANIQAVLAEAGLTLANRGQDHGVYDRSGPVRRLQRRLRLSTSPRIPRRVPAWRSPSSPRASPWRSKSSPGGNPIRFRAGPYLAPAATGPRNTTPHVLSQSHTRH